MYGFQKIKLSFLFLLAIMASGLFVVHTANAYEYKLGVSRIYNSDDIVGTGSQDIYTSEQFDGVAFCTGYYYVNHDKDHEPSQEMTLVRQSFVYNPLNTIISGDYMNLYNGWSINDEGGAQQYGPAFIDGNNLYIFALSTQSTTIPNTLSIARFSLLNSGYDDVLYLSGHYKADPSSRQSTQVTHPQKSLDFPDDSDYNFSIKYYAQPCVPDTPFSSTDDDLMNGIGGSTSASDGAIAEIPAIHMLNTNLNSGRPVTIGSNDFSIEDNFIPARKNIGQVDKDVTFDDGVFIRGIKEPDTSNLTSAYPQNYYYNSGSSRGSSFSGLDANFVAAAPGTVSNQWGIDPTTIEVTINFVGVDKNVYDSSGASCSITVSGETPLGLSGLKYSWNRNQLGYSVNISSGTLRSLAKSQCSVEFSSVDEANIDLKRETEANISWDAYDLSNSMIISQEFNTVSYANPNRINGEGGTTGYSFNSYDSDPILELATDTKNLNHGTTVYNIPIDNDKLLFTGTDDYAGVDSGTFLIIVTGYNSNIQKSNSRDTSVSADYTYTFSGTDITKFGYGEAYDRLDYTGFVDFASEGTVTTGMHFTVHFEVEDFVGNKETQNYIFRTPTYPNAPHGDTQNLQAQTNAAIDPVYMIEHITQDDFAIGDPGSNTYEYTGYYPSSSGLITNFKYISGSNYLDATTDLVVTAHNGNNSSNVLVTLTGISFVYNNELSYFTGTPHVSSGGVPMTDYLDTTFTFQILATNIYAITGVITYNMTVAPSCLESPGCTDPVYVYWGTNLINAQAQKVAADGLGVDYKKANHWYPHWFAEIKQTGPNFYFTGADNGAAKVLYCASTGNSMLINHDGYTGPRMNETNLNAASVADYTGTALQITGSDVLLFDEFTGALTANYELESVNGTDKMTIYVNRPLTGRVFYSVCELSGALDANGWCPENVGHNRTGDINWTQLTNQDVFTMTGWIEGGWMTGVEVNNWGTGFVSNGGGTRKYTQNITGDLREDINTGSSIYIENRTGSTSTVNYEVYWIDNTEVSMTGDVDVVENQSAIVTLSGYNTGVLSAVGASNLIGDDEYIVTKFSGTVEAKIFESGFGSTISTGQFYIDGVGSDYKMIHNIEFAEDRVGEICVEDRAGNQSCMDMNVTGIGTMEELVITVRPAFRPDPATNDTGYAIENADFWFWIMSGTVWTQNYNSAKGNDPQITTNKNGTGIVYIMTPTSGAEYLVVFKGSGTLSAGFTGIWSDTITDMNFFSGTYADKLSSDYVYKYNSENYLKVGDIGAHSTGTYDHVFTEDFMLINHNLTIGNNIIPEYRYDFDINDVISSMEQSMILQAYDDYGFIGWLDYYDIIAMTGFVDL